MTEKLVLLDGGYFVSRMAKHWAPKGRFSRWMKKVERKTGNYALKVLSIVSILALGTRLAL